MPSNLAISSMDVALLQWNCRGYKSNYEDLLCLIHEYSPACILLQETMLGNKSPLPPSMYDMYTFSRTGNAVPGDGLATLIKTGIPFQKININTNLQAMAFRIHYNKLYTICNLYISPLENVTVDQLNDLIKQLPTPYIISGDLNSKHYIWGNNTIDTHGYIIETVLEQNNAIILNTKQPTHYHVQSNTYSSLDITLCSAEVALDVEWDVHGELCGSDHFPTIMKTLNCDPVIREPRYIFEKANWNSFRDHTLIENFDDFSRTRTIDENIESINETLINAANMSIPTTDGSPRYRVPWWTDECELAVGERKNRLRIYQRSKSIADRVHYNKARAKAKNVLSNCRKTSWKSYVSKLNVNTPMNKIWKRIKKMKGKYDAHSSPYLIQNGAHITNDKDVADALASHYEYVSSTGRYNDEFKHIKQHRESVSLNFTERTTQHDYNSPITILELKTMLKKCKNTAAGPDKIHYKMLKNCHPSLLEVLLLIYNRIWTEGIYPNLWRQAIVLPFHKPGKPKEEVASYRPIALTSCIGKLMEKIVNTRLMFYLESRDLLPKLQFGFRKMKSTTDALVRLSSDILTAFEQRNSVLCVFFDIEKAYDTTWKHGILEEIHGFGIRGSLPIFLKNFLAYRRFVVKVGNSVSREHIQEQGVPQGSVLSCTLFSVAINGILKTLPATVQASLYVDDFMLYVTGKHLPSLERRLQVAINNVEKWTLTRGYNFSHDKTKCIHFHRRRGMPGEVSLSLSNLPIECVYTVKFLGLYFDQRLRWTEHINRLKAQCMKRLGLIKSVSHMDWGADRTTMLRLYRAIVRPKIDYGCTVYGSASPNVLMKLNSVHHEAIRCCTGAFRSSPVVSLYSESGEPSLQLRRDKLLFQTYVRCCQPYETAIAEYINQDKYNLNEVVSLNFGGRVAQASQQYNLSISNILQFSYDGCPVWQLQDYHVCEHFTYPKKKETIPQELKALYIEHINTYHKHQISIYTDGSKDGNHVGWAAVSVDKTYSDNLPAEASIFTAELNGILGAFKIIEEDNRGSFIIYTDSKSVLDITTQYYSTHPLVNRIISKLIELTKKNKFIQLCWVPSHSLINGNEKADTVAKEAAHSAHAIQNTALPFRDYYPCIKRNLWQNWNNNWINTENNKLRSINDNVRPWISSQCDVRRHGRILTRLRIGHTLLTHGHLMERRYEPS